MECPSNTVQETGSRATETSTAENLTAQGSSVNPSAKNDRSPATQEVIMMEENMNPELPNIVPTKHTTVTLCAKRALGI